MLVLVAFAATELLSSCTSTYYFPPSLKGKPSSELSIIKLQFEQARYSYELDGEPIDVPLWGMPQRQLAIAPGNHTLTVVLKRLTGGIIGFIWKPILDPMHVEHDLSGTVERKLGPDERLAISYTGVFVAGRAYVSGKTDDWSDMKLDLAVRSPTEQPRHVEPPKGIDP